MGFARRNGSTVVGGSLLVPLLSDATQQDVVDLRQNIKDAVADTQCLTDAAQAFCQLLFETYAESLVLARLYGVVKADLLPQEDYDFASRVAKDAGIAMMNITPVLNLLGTHGEERQWRDRRLSQNHRAIPLLGSNQVRRIPMVAGLLSDLGLDLGTLDTPNSDTTRVMLGGLNGLFYVPDARNERDDQGRLLIPDQQFVDQYGVKSVFGMGGSYLDGTHVVAILFCKESLPRRIVRRFSLLISHFKVATEGVVGAQDLYVPGGS